MPALNVCMKISACGSCAGKMSAMMLSSFPCAGVELRVRPLLASAVLSGTLMTGGAFFGFSRNYGDRRRVAEGGRIGEPQRGRETERPRREMDRPKRLMD